MTSGTYLNDYWTQNVLFWPVNSVFWPSLYSMYQSTHMCTHTVRLIVNDVKCLVSQTASICKTSPADTSIGCDALVMLFSYSELLYWSFDVFFLCWLCCHGDWWAAAVFCSRFSLIAECAETTALNVFSPLPWWSLRLSDHITASCSHFITVSLMQDNVSNCSAEQFITRRQPFDHAGLRDPCSGLTAPHYIWTCLHRLPFVL